MLVVGSCFILYPIIGNIINVMQQNAVQAEYNTVVQQLNEDKKQELKNNADDYNRKLASGELTINSVDEDNVENDYDDGSGYNDALSVGNDTLGIIKIPKIDVNLPIYKGTSSEILEKGIGHLRNTSLPVGGKSSHCVLTGHTGLPSSILFTDISKLEKGDIFYIQYLDEIHAYSVDQIKVVEPTDSSDLVIFPDKDYITLLTCYPYGINSHRLLVRGERIPYDGKINYDKKGNVRKIIKREIISETDDTPQQTAVNNSIFDDFNNNSVKVSVYGVNMSLPIVVTGSIIIISSIGTLIVITIIKSVKSRRKGQEK